MRELKFQVYKAIAGLLLIIASLKMFCSSQKYIFYVAKKKCSDIGNIGYKSTDTDIVILGPIYRYADIDIGASLKMNLVLEPKTMNAWSWNQCLTLNLSNIVLTLNLRRRL